MEGLSKDLSTDGKLISKVNPKIVKFSTRLTELSQRFKETREPRILEEIRKLRSERNKIPSRIRTGTRVYYVRYADD